MSIAEQKRRCTIKYGFEYLRTLVPSLAANPNLKISKAALLVKVRAGVLYPAHDFNPSPPHYRMKMFHLLFLEWLVFGFGPWIRRGIKNHFIALLDGFSLSIGLL